MWPKAIVVEFVRLVDNAYDILLAMTFEFVVPEDVSIASLLFEDVEAHI